MIDSNFYLGRVGGRFEKNGKTFGLWVSNVRIPGFSVTEVKVPGIFSRNEEDFSLTAEFSKIVDGLLVVMIVNQGKNLVKMELPERSGVIILGKETDLGMQTGVRISNFYCRAGGYEEKHFSKLLEEIDR